MFRSFQTIMIRILLFFYLASSSLSATHIHHDGISHADCKVCPIVKNIDSADTPSLDITLVISLYHDRDIFTTESVFVYTYLKGFHAQAPPVFS